MAFDIDYIRRKQIPVHPRSLIFTSPQKRGNSVDMIALVIAVSLIFVTIYVFKVITRLLTVKHRKKDVENNNIYNKDICPICFDELDTAIKIPCGHVYCFKCLKVYIAYQRNSGRVQCALCRRQVTSYKRVNLVKDHSVLKDTSFDKELRKLEEVQNTYLCTQMSIVLYFISWIMVVYSVNRYYI